MASCGHRCRAPGPAVIGQVLWDGVLGGPDQNVFSTCIADADLFDPLVPCTRPHHSELCADATALAPLTRTGATAGGSRPIMTGLSLNGPRRTDLGRECAVVRADEPA